MKRRRVPLTPERQELASRHVPLAKNMAWKAKQSTPIELDELKGVAQFALVEAAEAYDPSRKVKFSTFARYRIWGALMGAIKEDLSRGVCYEDSLEPDYREEAKGLFQIVVNSADEMTDAVDWVDVQLSRLPQRHAKVCRLIFVDGLMQRDAAEIMGTVKSNVCKLYRESLERLRDTV